MIYRHVLISRLNVFYKVKIPTHGYDPDKWLIERVKIFKEFCFPSVINQSNLNFKWIFYIDHSTPEIFKKELQKLFEPFTFIHLISHKFESFAINDFLHADITEIFNSNFEYLISSRIDTDDMIHKDFIQSIQNKFFPTEYCPINFNYGYVYDIQNGITSSTIHKYNPFISLIEKSGSKEFKTVFFKMHHEYKNDVNLKLIHTKTPMWCMTINQFNYSTSFFGKVILNRPQSFKDNFAIINLKYPSLGMVIKFKTYEFQNKWLKLKNYIVNRINFTFLV